VRVVLNGHGHELEEPATVSSAVAAIGAQPPAHGLAVAVDGEVVPRGDWERTALADGQRVEVLRAVQGGA